MKNKKVIWCFFLMICALSVPSDLGARSRSKRRGSITAALQETTSDGLFIKEPESMKLASIDKISFSFPDSAKEISRPVIEVDPKIVIEKEPLEPEEIARSQTLIQNKGYSLPKELQEQAKQELAKVEYKIQEDEKIELQFEDADLQTFVQQIADIFQVTFISDDAIDPLPKGSSEAPVRALKGNKISFKTTTPVTKQETWNLFTTFLNISGFNVIQQPDPTIYRIETVKASQRSPLNTFIGVDYKTLPENDAMIRYLYFIENATIDAMRNIVPSLQSSSAASPIWLSEQKAFILTDKAYNIRALMAIVKELDKVTMPQAMSVLKLRQADAEDVKKLYDELTQQGEDRSAFRPFGARKPPSAIFFPENARIIAEPRTNSLILLGPKDAIQKIEDFIVKHVDVELDQPYSPLYTYQLQYADATKIAEIMNTTTKLGQNTEAGKAGGVRGQDKYLKPMHFTPEPSTNKLIIRADYNDYLMAKTVIEDLDKAQPQVALDVLILSVDLQDTKELGTQLRSKVPGLDGILGQNVKFQTSGLRAGGTPKGIVTNPDGSGVNRLLGNLINLVTQAGPGNTILTLGQDIFGVWGIFQALRTITNVQVISNPFLFASNKTPAEVSLGQTIRVIESTIIGTDDTNTFGDDRAALTVKITPQINSDGFIILRVRVDITEFTSTDPNNPRKTIKVVETQAIVADREVLALGGLIRNNTTTSMSKTPILGDIPLLGWLFKNKNKNVDKDSLLILISTKIIPPDDIAEISKFTQERLNTYRGTLGDLARADSTKDPIHKLFFASEAEQDRDVGEFLFDRHQRATRSRKKMQREKAAKVGPYGTNEKMAQNSGRHRGRRGRRRATELPAITEPPVTITQSAPLQAIIPTSEVKEISATTLAQRKRRSRSLSSFLTDESEKQS